MASILPYLSDSWRERSTGLGLGDVDCFRGASVDQLKETIAASDFLESAVLVPRETVNAWPDRNLTTQFLQAANDYFVDEWLPKDERFRLAALVCGQDTAWSAQEVRRLADKSRVVAAAIAPMHVLLGDPAYYPLYEACIEAGWPLMVYPTGAEAMYIGAPQASGAPLSFIERRAVLTQIAQANVSSLVFDGVLDRYSELKVVFAGFGFSWLVPLVWRMDMDWRRTRVETPWVKRPPSEYIAEHIRFTTEPNDAPTDATELAELLELMGAEETLIYGSAFDGASDNHAPQLVNALASEMRERVISGSADGLFGT